MPLSWRNQLGLVLTRRQRNDIEVKRWEREPAPGAFLLIGCAALRPRGLRLFPAPTAARRLRPRGHPFEPPATAGQEPRRSGPSPALPTVTVLAFPLAAQTLFGRTSPGAVAFSEMSRLTGWKAPRPCPAFSGVPLNEVERIPAGWLGKRSLEMLLVTSDRTRF